jgi:hypothetical protein
MKHLIFFKECGWQYIPKLLLNTGVSIVFLVLIQITAHAQTEPNILITWKATGYAPSSYVGKILPTKNSQITVSFNLISQGKIVDLSKLDISWNINSSVIAQGAGLQTITFTPPRYLSTRPYLRISIKRENATALLYGIMIPITNPETIIEFPSAIKQIANSSFTVRALPYFFDVEEIKSLSFAWEVNGKAPLGNESPDVLTVHAPTSSLIPITIDLSVRSGSREGARGSLSLTSLQ